MFIKRAQADARLSDKNNLLRRPDARRDSCETTDEDERLAEEALHGVKPEATRQEKPDSSQGDGEIAESITDEPRVKDELPILKELDDLLNPHAHSVRNPYRGNRDSQVAIGETAIILGPKVASSIFGLGPEGTQAEAYSEGKAGWGDGRGGKVIPEVWQRLQKSKQNIAEKAASRLESTLDAITPGKLKAINKVETLARVGKDMAIIIEKVTPKETGPDGGVHFHIFRPEFKQENHYETVTLASSVPEQK